MFILIALIPVLLLFSAYSALFLPILIACWPFFLYKFIADFTLLPFLCKSSRKGRLLMALTMNVTTLLAFFGLSIWLSCFGFFCLGCEGRPDPGATWWSIFFVSVFGITATVNCLSLNCLFDKRINVVALLAIWAAHYIAGIGMVRWMGFSALWDTSLYS